jgi:WD40 repeat protein
MASTLSASAVGLEIVDRARQKKDWTKVEVAWQVTAEVSKSTLDRFWMGKPIKRENFKAICMAVGVDWEQAIDELPEIEPRSITRKSNLAQVNQPVILELEEFGQQVAQWFQALGFKQDSLPRREGKYLEWAIQVPQRRAKWDRVLIRATIHEVGLSDLDSLRRGVAQLRVDEGWLVTNLWVSQAVKQVLVKPGDDKNLSCLTFDELIDQDADFTPYFGWLEAEINKIKEFYVPLDCRKGEFDPTTRQLRSSSDEQKSKNDIDFYIDRWLATPATEHVSILGEFGTGKTWFTLHYAWQCFQAYQIAKDKGLPRPRLPLVIRLRDYAKSLDVSNVMAGFFFNQHNIKLNHAVFDRLNQMGKLLLIFDGFDEMADKVDRQKMTENFRELVKVITPNSKVILTCRTEHFDTAQDAIDKLHEVQIKFETLELVKFNDEQIRAVLSRRTNAATVERVMGNVQLLDLLRRAVMAEYVLAALPKLEEKSGKIDISRVYLYAVWRKMDLDITTGRTFTSLADKLYFLCELSWEMLSEEKMSLNYRDFPDRLRRLFKDEVKEQKHLDHWYYDMIGQTMLIRNDDGDYSPAHRSLLEFFAAYKLAAELGLLADDFLEIAQSQSELNIDRTLPPRLYRWAEYWEREIDECGQRKPIAFLAGFRSESSDDLRETFGKSPLSRAMLDLLKPALNLVVKYRQTNPLIELIQSTQAAKIEYSGGNAATILVEMEPNALEYHNLRGTNLAWANLMNAGLRGTDLSGTNLENCLITKVFGTPNPIVMSKDDLQMITAHDDGTIRIWERATGRELQRLTGHQGGVTTIALSGDGRWLYSGSYDNTIKEWNLADGICQRTFEGHQGGVTTIALSGNGRWLYSGSYDNTIKEWNLADGRCGRTFEDHLGAVRTIALSGDGRWLYSGSDDSTIKEWNLADGRCGRTFEGHLGAVRTIALSGNGRWLYSGSYDETIKEWSLADGKCGRTFWDHLGLVETIALSGDGRWLYSGSYDHTIKEWNLADGSCGRTFEDHLVGVTTIALSGDGRWLYSGSYDETIKEWNLADGRCERTFAGHQAWLETIALSGDGRWLYSGSDDKTIKEWNLADGRCGRTFEGHQGGVETIALSGDGRWLYSGSGDKTIKEWNLADGRCGHTFEGHQGGVETIALSGDGRWLYSGSDDSTIKEWNLADGRCGRIFEGHQGTVWTIALSGDGRWLYSGSGDKTIKEWNLADGRCGRTFEGHQGTVWTIALSGDGRRLYSGSYDKTIKEWSLADGRCGRTFEGHQDLVTTIALSGDGRWLYSGSGDKTIVWDLVSGAEVRSIDHRLCAGANITNVKGLTSAQTDALIALGARDDNK